MMYFMSYMIRFVDFAYRRWRKRGKMIARERTRVKKRDRELERETEKKESEKESESKWRVSKGVGPRSGEIN